MYLALLLVQPPFHFHSSHATANCVDHCRVPLPPLLFYQVDPFLVRYCPYQPSEDGIYIVKVFAALQARFFWELSWQVTVEATGETYRGTTVSHKRSR